MRGMLLAAGRAQRMEPLSTYVAKPALEVLGEPLLASGWRLLADAGCRPITVNLFRHPAQVAAAARSMDPERGLLELSLEEELLGGAGGVAAVRTPGACEPFLVANADTWSRLDLSALSRVAGDRTIHMALLPHPDPLRWRSVILDSFGRVDAILEPGEGDSRPRFLFTGVQRLGGRVTAELPDPPCEWAEIWREQQEAGQLFGVVVRGQWREAGEPEAYRRLVLDLLPGRRSWVHTDARVARSARLEHSAVGAGCSVGAGAEIVGTVLTGGARVRPGVRLAGCVVAGRVTLDDMAGQGQLILPHQVVPLTPAKHIFQN